MLKDQQETVKRMWRKLVNTYRRSALKQDIRIHKKLHTDLNNHQGVELLILHLDKSDFKGATFSSRRRHTVETYSATGYELLRAITLLRRSVEARDSIPKNLLSTVQQVVVLDDFLVDEDDVEVSYDVFYRKLKERITGYLELLVDLEHTQPTQAHYYWRKTQPLLEDAIVVLLGLLDAVNE